MAIGKQSEKGKLRHGAAKKILAAQMQFADLEQDCDTNVSPRRTSRNPLLYLSGPILSFTFRPNQGNLQHRARAPGSIPAQREDHRLLSHEHCSCDTGFSLGELPSEHTPGLTTVSSYKLAAQGGMTAGGSYHTLLYTDTRGELPTALTCLHTGKDTLTGQ